MNIDGMPSGPEMDRLIAEKVMGWKSKHRADKCDGVMFIKCGACGRSGHGNCYGNGDGQIQIKCGEHTSCCDESALPEYSIKITPAFEVMEKLNEPWLCRLPDDTWECETKGAVKVWALTAPLAICRAALKAVRS